MGRVLPITSKTSNDWYAAICKDQPDGVMLDAEAIESFNQAFDAYSSGAYGKAYGDFKKLAGKGSSISQYFLGVMCYRGIGALQDFLRAHMWFNISASHGHRKARKYLDQLTRSLSREQVAEAQQMARHWVDQNLEIE